MGAAQLGHVGEAPPVILFNSLLEPLVVNHCWGKTSFAFCDTASAPAKCTVNRLGGGVRPAGPPPPLLDNPLKPR